MKAIESNAMISKDRILTLQLLQLPRDVQPGQHHIFSTDILQQVEEGIKIALGMDFSVQ
jgi:hypothetical protein